jgi:ribosomal protein S18 acetylase RimI-like enzyme
VPTHRAAHPGGDESLEIEVRSATNDDVDLVLGLDRRQEIGWWGEPESERDEVETCFEMVRLAYGDVGSGSFVAQISGVAVGFAAMIGHGDAALTVDPTHEAHDVVADVLIGRLVEAGVETLDAPRVDGARIEAFARVGFTPTRSSFDLERDADLADLVTHRAARVPDGTVVDTFDPARDAEAVHTMLYEFWTDVPGHRFRPLDEWSTIFLDVDPSLVVVVRPVSGGPPIGVALCRRYSDGMGWVSQLGVARSARGLGLGRAILVEAFARLVAAGATRIGLSVEAANDGALGLYRSVGMAVEREWVHCTRSGDEPR